MSKRTLVWNKKLPEGVGKAQHYSTLADLIGSSFKKTSKDRRIHISPNLYVVLLFCDRFVKTDESLPMFGDYIGGKLDDVEVMIVNSLPKDTFELLANDRIVATGKVICE